MKKIVLVIFSLVLSVNVTGYNKDSLKIATLQKEVGNLKSTVNRIQLENGRLKGLYQQQFKLKMV